MPYEWLAWREGDSGKAGGYSDDAGHPPTLRLHLWPHRSLPRRGFVAFIGGTALLIALPLMTLLGSPVLWGLLPFLVAAVAGIWFALDRSYRDGEIVEDLALTPDRISLTRHGPRGRRQDWQANPHWVRVELHATGGPVPQYLTLQGGGRRVELGAFLSEPERVALRNDLEAALRQCRNLQGD